MPYQRIRSRAGLRDGRHIAQLPNEILAKIFDILVTISFGDHPLRSVRRVSRRWRAISLRSHFLLIAPLPSVPRQLFNLPPYAVNHLSLPTSRFLAPYISGTELCLFGNPIADFNHWHRPHWIIFHGVLVLPLLSRKVPLIVSGQDTLCKQFSNLACKRCLDSSRYVVPLTPPIDKLRQQKNGSILDYYKPLRVAVRRRTLTHDPKRLNTGYTPKITEYFFATHMAKVGVYTYIYICRYMCEYIM